MEKFFGEEGASKKPEYDFIIDPNLNQAYQQLRVQPVAEQRQQAKMQAEMMEQQMAAQEQQMQMQQMQGAPPQDAGGDPQAQQMQQQPSPSESEPQEETQKSASAQEDEPIPVRDLWLAAKGLKKSVHGEYFRAWLDSHYDKINKE